MTQYDVIIIGRGPAGLSAALYTARAKLSTLVLGSTGSALDKAAQIENYFGFEQPVSGPQLLQAGVKQAQRLGVALREEQVTAIEPDDGYLVTTDAGQYRAKTLLIATGQPPRRPNIAGITELEGRGVSYCTTCDGFFFRNRRVGILGNGNYAVQEALELLPLTNDITIFTNGQPPRFTGDYAAHAARLTMDTRPITALKGQDALSAVALADEEVPLDGLFVAQGTASSVDFAAKLGVFTENNAIVVDENGRTNLDGVFAAGDCTGGLRQIAVAVGQGAMAGKSIIDYVRAQAKITAAAKQAV